jgi:ABC-type oligopeptide transport system ATPase subunit
MSLYTEWLNRIKTMATCEWLTDSQSRAYDDIRNRWQAAPFVCLTGSSGCGKTFIARLFARELGYAYVHHIQEAQPGQGQVLIDGEEYNRLMRPIAAMLNLKRVIIVCRRAPKDPMPCSLVAITEKDVKQFKHNLVRYAILPSFQSDVRGTDLSEILRSEAVARARRASDGAE